MIGPGLDGGATMDHVNPPYDSPEFLERQRFADRMRWKQEETDAQQVEHPLPVRRCGTFRVRHQARLARDAQIEAELREMTEPS